MALSTNRFTYGSGDSVTGVSTIRENLGNLITILSPRDVPLWTVLEKPSTPSIEVEWLMDDIAKPTSISANIEGAGPSDLPDSSLEGRARMRNICMITDRTVMVSNTLRDENEAGVSDEFAYQVQDQVLELGKAIEYNLHWSKFQAGDSSTARQMAGLIEWLALTGLSRTEGADPTIAGRTIDSSKYGSVWVDFTSAMTRDTFNSQILQPAWENGANINAMIVMAGGTVKRRFGNFTQVYDQPSETSESLRRTNVDIAARMDAIGIDLFQSDFGAIMFALDRYMDSDGSIAIQAAGTTTAAEVTITGDDSFFAIDPEHFTIPIFRPVDMHPLAVDGDRARTLINAEYSLKVHNPIAGFGASNVDGS